MERITKVELQRLTFHPIALSIRRTKRDGYATFPNQADDSRALVIFNGQLLGDWWLYRFSLDRGFGFIESFDPGKHGGDPVTYAFTVPYLDTTNRALGAARLMPWLQTAPADLAPYAARLEPLLRSMQAAAAFASAEWGIPKRTFERARAIAAAGIKPICDAIIDGRLSLTRADEAVHALAADSAARKQIEGLTDPCQVLSVIAETIAKDRQVKKQREQKRENREMWVPSNLELVQPDPRVVAMLRREMGLSDLEKFSADIAHVQRLRNLAAHRHAAADNWSKIRPKDDGKQGGSDD